MGLKEQITSDMKDAMRAKEAKRLSTIRMLTAAIKQKEVDERITLEDKDVLAIIEKMIKQRRDSIEQFKAGGREDLAASESEEVEILSAYMPEAMSQAEIEQAVADAVKDATGMKDMGRVMNTLRAALAGRADMGAVSGLVKKALAAK